MSQDSLELVMLFELGRRKVYLYRRLLTEWYVIVWDGVNVRAIECVCAEQALEMFDRCLGEPVAEA